MNTTLFLIILMGLAIFYFILGLIASRRVHTTTDYFLAGRNLGLFPIAFSLIGAQLGGAMLLGTSQDAYQVGVYGILYTLGIVLGFLLLASGFAARLQTFNVATTAELFETHYGSVSLKKIASFLSIITLCGILVSQIVGSKALILGVAPHADAYFIIFWLFLIMYTMIGGLAAVVITDVAQVLFIITVFVSIFLYSIWQEPSWSFNIIELQKTFSSSCMNSAGFIATLIMPALFSLIEQDLAQRFFAARNRTIATGAVSIAMVFIFLFSFIPLYFGMKAKLMGLPLPEGTSPLIPVIHALTNDYVVIFALCGIIAAITSTAASLLCAVSSNIAQDFGFTTNKNHLYVSKIITLLVGLSALYASYIVPVDVIGIVVGSYEISVSCLLVPLLFVYFNQRVTKRAAWGAILAGGISFVLLPLWKTTLSTSLIPLGCSLIGFLIGNYVFVSKD
jgi:SSS family solute:Na+ symporter